MSSVMNLEKDSGRTISFTQGDKVIFPKAFSSSYQDNMLLHPSVLYIDHTTLVCQLPPRYTDIYYSPLFKDQAGRVPVDKKTNFRILLPWLTFVVSGNAILAQEQHDIINSIEAYFKAQLMQSNLYVLSSASRINGLDDSSLYPFKNFPNIMNFSRKYVAICESERVDILMGLGRDPGSNNQLQTMLYRISRFLFSSLNDNATSYLEVSNGKESSPCRWEEFLRRWEKYVDNPEQAHILASSRVPQIYETEEGETVIGDDNPERTSENCTSLGQLLKELPMLRSNYIGKIDQETDTITEVGVLVPGDPGRITYY